ncbi:MAG: HPr(Ser) kinase/phosphatase [bacterium]|nr:HPr(Ser) kinase/phosphatase [bacterium]
MPSISIKRILEECGERLRLEVAAGGSKIGLKKRVSATSINRPGLALTGYMEHFTYRKIQVLGKLEISYLNNLTPAQRLENLNRLFEHEIPCFIVTWNQGIPPELVALAETQQIPILKTSLRTVMLITQLTLYLEDKFAAETTIHASLVDVFGMGVLMLGRSGAGKSECALELLERGHRLIADDIVEIKRVGNKLLGKGAELIKYHMEIRGLGIINIKELFGVSAICDTKELELVVNLEEWRQEEYDRLGLEEKAYTLLGVKLPYLIIPVKPGRNIAIITEVGVMNQRLKYMGYHPAEKFNQRLVDWMETTKTGQDGTAESSQ